MNFDLNYYKKSLYEEAKKIFPQIIEESKHENIYSLALYNSGDFWSYLFPTVSTVQSLENVVLEYKEMQFYQKHSIEELRNLLKWSPCDSPKHGLYDSSMPKTEEIIKGILQLFDGYIEKNEIKIYEKQQNQLVNATLETLQKLDANGVFASLERTSFVLNLLNGDQSNEERIKRARLLNPTSVSQKYEIEI